MSKWNIQNIKIKAKELNNNIIILNESYDGYISPMYYYCFNCKNTSIATWKSLRQNNCNCNACNMKNKSNRMKDKKTINKLNKNNITLVKDGKVEIIGEYVGARDKIKTKCLVCNNIWEPIYQHLKAGHGCPKCSKSGLGWSRSNWVNKALTSKEFDSYKLYKIKYYGMNEEFYKIGITYTSIESRLKGFKYNYEIVEIIESDNGEYIWNLEKELHKLNKVYKYVPKIKFKGMQECFEKIL